ncbi:hypothetical protein BaRGS_00027814, partial [Batillaria attramentaria]
QANYTAHAIILPKPARSPTSFASSNSLSDTHTVVPMFRQLCGLTDSSLKFSPSDLKLFLRSRKFLSA